ncbi:amidohydrolase family protein [Gilvibacter sp.]|uniref:amidohydrolase family protein n=1 Tax=Gilvibacter sp. TaxID=2729997 RepID=UPI0025C21147|nr:amidohydrolase family protein [Gilvibacter sp.]NQX78384.1 amidohydrolase family protein [Gilvibacter sp.]
MKFRLLLLCCLFLGGQLAAQDYFPDNDGVKEQNTNYTAFTGATIYVTPTKILQNATLVIRNGKVVSVGTNVTVPQNSIIVDASGTTIYPSFIDPYTEFGVKKAKRAQGGGRSPQYNPSRAGFYWNDHIMPEYNAIADFKFDNKAAATMRKAGFGVVGAHRNDGIAQGTGVLVALNSKGDDADRVLNTAAGQYFSFDRSVASRQSYPTSLMGAMALLRQMYYDMSWYEAGNSNTTDRSLEALIEKKGMYAVFNAGDKGNDLRADKVGDQFGIQYVIVGGGDEYEAIADIKATNATYILPINFPDAYDVSNPYQADYVTLADMRNWNQAPANPKIMADNGVPFAFTTYDLKSAADFKGKLMKAIKYGLDKTTALEALTTVPARIIGMSETLGNLNPGAQANFLITSGDIFESSTTLYENWVQGTKNVINDRSVKDIRGTYTLMVGGKSYDMTLSGDAGKPKIEIKQGDTKFPAKLTYNDNWVILSMTDEGNNDIYRMTAAVVSSSDNLSGRLVLPNGRETSFNANKTAGPEEAEKKASGDADEAPTMVDITYPNIGYGYSSVPQSQNILFKNATVWTGEADGILMNTDVLVRDGKIVAIGENLSARGAKVIDATGKHLTAGIIDEHSHIAALAINEAGHNSSAEVTIEDVVDPEDIDIYRNLAGGVTSIQILHGSANPIGGRSAIIKLKWGESADNMIYNNTPKFIKFALGENVKQSNWQSYSRFPQTRMGVEQLYMNYFSRAKEYDAKKKSGANIRYDEELEVLAQILNGERFISCHSYVQSEINMLMKVAEKFNFRVNTFTHILEGYKVADKMAEHGVGGSTFSDWWAYKYEVNDAIPYNAAIMAREGVVVAINSDDGEMSRRLNQEAAKTVKYGGMSEEEAWKMVTLNPAKLLHIDDRVGSIKVGKDADLVLWTDNPLSVYARAEQTYIEGALFFDLEKDGAMRSAIQQERNTLIKMMLDDKGGKNGNKRRPGSRPKQRFTCETI